MFFTGIYEATAQTCTVKIMLVFVDKYLDRVREVGLSTETYVLHAKVDVQEIILPLFLMGYKTSHTLPQGNRRDEH